MNSSDQRRALPFMGGLVLGFVVLLFSNLAWAQNAAPAVDAGVDQCIAPYTEIVTLDATVSDDGLPNPPATYTVTWTKQSGPGTVTFGNANAVDTTATFSAVGTYVLRLTADDDDLTAYDEVTIGVSVRTTLPAKIEVEDYRYGASGTAYYDAIAGNSGGEYRTDDVDIYTCDDTGGGYMIRAVDIDEWISFDVNVPSSDDYDFTFRVKTSGAGQLHVEIDDEDVTGTLNCYTGSVWADIVEEDVSLTAGNHVMKIVFDYNWNNSGEMINWIEMTHDNSAPTVDVGADLDVNLPNNATLDATVTDDGWPNYPGSITTTWTKTSGPGTVTFGNSSAVDTTATFSVSGVYVLRLTADDGDETDYDELTVNVNSPPSVDAGSDAIITWPTDETNLDGTVSDDGYPSSPGTYTVTWTKQSGAGTVTFTNANAVDTTATFSASGTYVLRLTADDGDATAYDEVTIEVNVAPSVEAGSNAVITWPTDETNLDATVSDDGFPASPGTYTVTWTKQSGPGTVTFTNANAEDTTAEFSASGTYVLRLTAGDGDTTAYDEVTVEVNSVPTVNAGADDEIIFPADATLDATVTDDGLPSSPGTYTVLWTKQSGPGTVTFGDDDAVDTTAAFSVSGVYVLRLTADDGDSQVYDEVQITVTASNTAPTVDAGVDQGIAPYTATATLDATVSDDGLPNPPATYTVTWTKQSGPGTVTFGNANSVDTTAVFDTVGTYVLRLTADDGDLTAYEEVTVGVSSRTTLPAKIEVEDYRYGGEGVGYHDTYGLPDLTTCDDEGGGEMLRYMEEGEWVAYDVYIPSSGDYDFTFRVKTISLVELHVEIDGVDVTGTFTAYSGTVWSDVVEEDVSLTAGDHVMKIVFDNYWQGSLGRLNWVEITADNTAPTVDAGVDQDVTLPGNATLDATVTDDGNPSSPGTYTVTWTKTSGPGTVTFGDSSAVDTTAAFSVSGVYVLRLTADDSALTDYDELTVNVNSAPSVNAGIDDTITWPTDTVNLDATVSDDGYPTSPGTYTVTWTKQSGSGTVTFTNANAVDTTATFSASGTYVLRLTADDGDATAYDEVQITVAAANAAPTVDAGVDQCIAPYTEIATLDATVSDDGLPNPPATYTVTWTKQSGPGTVTFGNANAVDTTATFSAVGTYVLRLTADDDDLTAYDEVTIGVSVRTTLPAKIEVEDYRYGASGTAYYDAIAGNSGGEYRTDDVDIYVCDDTGGGYMIRAVDADEWISFDVNVPSSDDYDFTFRVKTSGAGQLHVEIDDEDVTGTLNCYTGSVWADIVEEDVSLTAGNHVMKIVFDYNWNNSGEMINWIEITAENTAPTVNAGVDQDVTLPGNATLDATVTDDGNPTSPGTYTVTWTKTSGPGTVTFGDSSAVDTTAAFSVSGVYVLRLTADDSALTDYDELTVNVNSAPSVNAGIDDTITWPTDTVNLDATVSDDGYPTSPGTYTVTWTKQSGSGTVTFTNANAVDTTATFSASGTYVLRLTADDGDATAYDEVQITVAAANTAPTVDAGLDDVVAITSGATLDATVTDDGLPATPGTYTVTWTKQSGPGTVTFGNSSAVDTTASFDTTGTYVLRLTADDDDLTAYDELTVVVVTDDTFILPCKIEIEDYRDGGEGVGYHDSSGLPDLTTCDDEGGGEMLRYIVEDEWVAYNVYIPTSGDYNFTFRVKTISLTELHVEIDGEDVTGTFTAYSGTIWADVIKSDVSLTAGNHVMKVVFDNSWSGSLGRLNWVEITGGTCFNLPGTIQAEDYHDYCDYSSGNAGGAYRGDDVDIYTTLDSSGNYDVGYMEEDEWLSYNVHLSEGGHFKFTVRARTTQGSRQVRVFVDDEDVSGPILFGPTYDDGDPPVYEDCVKDGIPIPAGDHVLKILFESDSYSTYKTNWFKFETSQSGPDVDAGPDWEITLPATVALDATVTDNGLPDPPGEFTTRWTVDSYPNGGTAVFDDRFAVDTTVTFDSEGTYVLRLTANDGLAMSFDTMTVVVNEATDRVTLPARLEAEDYADQGEGISYHDTTSGNAGSTYRSDDVDIESCGDTGGGYDVYTIADGEWLAFDVNVPYDTTSYDIVARVNSSTSSRQMHVEVDGVDVTGAMTFDSTGGWTDVTAEGVYMSPGRHTVKVVMDTGDFTLNYVDILAETYEEYIVEDGVANADIVISTDPPRSTELAADELQEIIEDITGATLPIVTTPTGADVHIYVGQSSYTDALGISTSGLEYDAFKMVSGSNWLALIGNDTDYVPIEPDRDDEGDWAVWDAITGSTYLVPMNSTGRWYHWGMDLWGADGFGSINAVYEFLRNLGCRWYFPDEIGEIIPALDDIGLPAVNRTVEPDYPLRYMVMVNRAWMSSDEEEIKWRLRLGINRGTETLGWTLGHGIGYVIGRDEMKVAHPEYYVLIDGVRQTEGWKEGWPCLSSTGLMAENVNFVQNVFDHYDEPMISVAPTDGFRMCECPLCEGKETYNRIQRGWFSDYVHAYAEEIASEVYLTHPSKNVTATAYATFFMPPLDIEEFSPNVVVYACAWTSWLQDEQYHKEYTEMVDDWLRILPSKQFVLRDYYLEGVSSTRWGNPTYIMNMTKEQLLEWKDYTIGTANEVGRTYAPGGVPTTEWDAIAAGHLNVYVASRLLWDANLDLTPMLDEYYEKFYGPAAAEMKEFVEYAEAHHVEFFTDSSVLTTERSLLDDAITAASGSGVYADRVDMLDLYLQLTENEAPTVSAGDDDSVTLPANASLDGTVSDDGLPTCGSVTQTWSMTSGPGTVTFGDEDAVDTTAAFSAAGTYVLRLTADDTYDEAYDEVTITVSE